VSNQCAKTKKSGGRPAIGEEIKMLVADLAQKGWQRKDIALEMSISLRSVTTILTKNGIKLPRGGDRKSEAYQLAVAGEMYRREPAGWMHDKRLSVETAASWTGSAYKDTQLLEQFKHQKELPRRLSKIFNQEGIGRTVAF
jgi:hypothetical protein